MLRVLGSHKRFCDGLTRRDLLHVGALAPLGLTLADWSRAAERAPASTGPYRCSRKGRRSATCSSDRMA